MKPFIHNEQSKAHGYVLLVVMGLASAGAIAMALVLDWSSKNANFTDRHNEYFTTSYAAEAATEKVFARMARDYQNYGEGVVYSKMSNYVSDIPTASDDSYWANYGFNDGNAKSNKVFLKRTNPTNSIVLGPPYVGLHAFGATYQIIANAKKKTSAKQITGAVGQEINLGTIPIFQFAIFYQEDMEVNPGAPMTIRGLVHGNSDIYVDPASTLVFTDDVSASGEIIMHKKPGDPQSRSGTASFGDYHLSGTNPLNLPIGTNTTDAVKNMANNVHAILEVPPLGESANSSSGTNRLFNQADLILLVTEDEVSLKSGIRIDESETTIPKSQWSTFVKTNEIFYNKRENLNVQSVTIDVNQLRKWSLTNTAIFDGREVQSLYVADLRPTSNAVPVTNFTVATNFVLVTNTKPRISLTFPATDTYLGVVNNTSIRTNSPSPAPAAPPAFSVVTNTTHVTTEYIPAPGTYVGVVTTNTTKVKNARNYPEPGTYVGNITKKNGKYTYDRIDDYSYNKITSYSYSLPAFVYNEITGTYTNQVRQTNYYYSTNYTIFAESGIVLTNGSRLPSLGLTVATPDPVYIIGDYNTTQDGSNFASGSDTSRTRPAAIMADAITILSKAWNPANSGNSIGSRVAANTMVNAAFLAGIVPTKDGYYSGGVENFPRFLENWSGKTFTYNGSMAVLFNSRVAIANWGGSDVYNPPNRNWAFDNNFMDPRKLPPLTPQVLSVTKGKWALIAPNTTSF